MRLRNSDSVDSRSQVGTPTVTARAKAAQASRCAALQAFLRVGRQTGDDGPHALQGGTRGAADLVAAVSSGIVVSLRRPRRLAIGSPMAEGPWRSAIGAVDDDGVSAAVSSGRLGDKEQSIAAEGVVVQLEDPLAQAWYGWSAELEQERVIEAGERYSARRRAREILNREELQADRRRAPECHVERLSDSARVGGPTQPRLARDGLGRRNEPAHRCDDTPRRCPRNQLTPRDRGSVAVGVGCC
jgi:hypothetical protein